MTPLASGQSLLTAADIVATPGFTITPMSEEDLIKGLNEQSTLYANQPEVETTTCLDEQLGALAIKANAKSLVVNATLDTTACSNASKDKDSSFKFTESTIKIRFYVECTSGDLSSLNGKTMKVLDEIDANKLCSSGTSLSETVATASATSTDPDNPASVNVSNIGFSGDPQLKGCKFSTVNGISSTADGCIDVYKNDTTLTSGDSVTKAEDFEKYTMIGLRDDVSSKSNVWYSAGTIGVVYNDWTGKLTYTGVASAPSYELTQSGVSTPISGKLTATASALLLTKSTQRAERRLMGRISNIFGHNRSH